MNQGRLGATEVSKYEFDKKFKEKQIYNLNWQIENGIEARLKSKQNELNEVHNQLHNS